MENNLFSGRILIKKLNVQNKFIANSNVLSSHTPSPFNYHIFWVDIKHNNWETRPRPRYDILNRYEFKIDMNFCKLSYAKGLIRLLELNCEWFWIIFSFNIVMRKLLNNHLSRRSFRFIGHNSWKRTMANNTCWRCSRLRNYNWWFKSSENSTNIGTLEKV